MFRNIYMKKYNAMSSETVKKYIQCSIYILPNIEGTMTFFTCYN